MQKALTAWLPSLACCIIGTTVLLSSGLASKQGKSGRGCWVRQLFWCIATLSKLMCLLCIHTVLFRSADADTSDIGNEDNEVVNRLDVKHEMWAILDGCGVQVQNNMTPHQLKFMHYSCQTSSLLTGSFKIMKHGGWRFPGQVTTPVLALFWQSIVFLPFPLWSILRS